MLPDALREALGQVIADQRREWRREREVIQAQAQEASAESRRVIAELRAEIAELKSALNEKVDAKLATVRDGEPGASVTLAEVQPLIDDAVTRAIAALPKPKDGQDGKSVDLMSLDAMIEERTAAAVASLPAAENGKDADPEVIRAMVDEAVAKLPPAEPGKSVDPAEVERMVDEKVAAAVEALPKPADGKSIEIKDVEPLIAAEVEKAVAALPPAEPGKPGESVTKDDVAPMIATEIAKAVAAIEIPKPENGKDADPVDMNAIRDMVDESVARAVEALPPAKEGPPGKLPAVSDWEDRVYRESDVVAFDGGVYQANRDTGKAPGHQDWRCIVPRGKDGADGRSFTVRGTWADGETYKALDVVALDGGGYVARRDDPGPCPGDGWQLIAMRGKPGRPGEKGNPGVGLRGGDGAKVVSMEINDDGIVTLKHSDGSTVTADFYPLLSKLNS